MNTDLFKEFDIEKPSSIPPYALALIDGGVCAPEEIQGASKIECFSAFLSICARSFRHPKILRSLAAENQRTLNREKNINLGDAELVTAIMNAYGSVNFMEILPERDLSGPEACTMALKLGLDFARGKMMKIESGKHPLIFSQVFMVRPEDKNKMTEGILASILEIFECAIAEGHDVSESLALLKKLAPHIWRSSVTQALENFRINSALLHDGIKLAVPGSDTPITAETEIAAVREHLSAARRRIGEALLVDLEEELRRLLPGIAN